MSHSLCADALLVPVVSLWCAKAKMFAKIIRVEKTLASEGRILHFMAFDIISVILSRVCLAYLFVNFFSLLYLDKI